MTREELINEAISLITQATDSQIKEALEAAFEATHNRKQEQG